MLDKFVMRKMGNRALAEKAARKYQKSIEGKDQEGSNFDKSKMIINIIGLPLSILLLLFHLFFGFLSFAYLMAVYLRARKQIDWTKYRDGWKRLVPHWARYPFLFLSKAADFTNFYDFMPDDAERSLEIGVYTGGTSHGFFGDKKFSAGVEYNIDRLLICQKKGLSVHDKLFSTDIRCMPFGEESFDSIYCVHSVDDMEFDVDDAFKEVARTLSPGGKFVFSGVTENYMRHNMLSRMALAVGLRPVANFIFRNIYIGSFNCNNRQKWQEILEAADLEIIEFRTFVPFNFSSFFDLAFRPEVVLLNIFGWTNWLKPVVQTAWYRGLLFRATAALVYISQQKQSPEGINFFIVAKKKHSDPDTQDAKDGEISLRCVSCGNDLEESCDNNESSLLCNSCGTRFSVVNGIPVCLVIADDGET